MLLLPAVLEAVVLLGPPQGALTGHREERGQHVAWAAGGVTHARWGERERER